MFSCEVREFFKNIFFTENLQTTSSRYCKNVFNNDNNDEADIFQLYIIIDTCASTRGVILNLVPDASTGTFVNSVSKFISKRGCPQIVLPVSGIPYVADTAQQFLSNKNIQWKFALSKDQWYGGFWERLRKHWGKSHYIFIICKLFCKTLK